MQQPKVVLSKTVRDRQQLLLVGFKYDFELKEYLKKYPGIEWSGRLRSFYMQFDKVAVNQLITYLRLKGYNVDYSALLEKKTINAGASKSRKLGVGPDILDATLLKLAQFKKWMSHKRYSSSTINTYGNMLLLFFRFLHPRPVEAIGPADVLTFNTDYILANGFSYTYQNQAINAIKLFYGQQANVLLLPEALERPKKSRKLPQVLSIAEVKTLLANIQNLKHKTLLSLLYSCGLRIGEALKLQLIDIDLNRRFLHIKSAKGAKDRYVPISKQMIVLLRTYLVSYAPQKNVFEGQGGGMYSTTSARQVLKRALVKSGIHKPVTLHTLRHSHATHLLENGTDLRFIQELLGHNSPKTTMIYTHVSTTSLEKIKNPFDDFDL